MATVEPATAAVFVSAADRAHRRAMPSHGGHLCGQAVGAVAAHRSAHGRRDVTPGSELVDVQGATAYRADHFHAGGPSMSSRWPRLAVLALAVLVCGVRPSPAADPIRIGYIGPLTGIFAQAGKDMLDGLRLSLEGVNHEVAGRKIELIAEDSEGNPATALAKYRKLTTHDKIHVLDGVLLSH